MDKPLEASFLRTLAQEIIAPSQEFEPFVPGLDRSATERLAVLGHLEPITSEKLAHAREDHKRSEMTKALAEEKARRAKASAAATRTAYPAQSRSHASSQRPAYQKALTNPEVVDALLRLSRSARPDPRAAQAQPSLSRPRAPASFSRAGATPQNTSPFRNSFGSRPSSIIKRK